MPTPVPPSSESKLTSSHDQEPDGTVVRAPGATDYTSAGSPSRCKTRQPLSVRLVDEYGRAQDDAPITPSRKDVRGHSVSMRMPGGGPLKTPRSASVRMVDTIGHEVEDLSEQNDSEDTVT